MAFAVPAQRVAKVFKQADGTEITAMLVGDESFHFYQTTDFVPLVRDAEGNFYYATISADRRLVSSNILAHNEADRNEIEKNFIKTAQEAKIESTISEIHRASAQKYSEMRKAGAATILPEGQVNVPVLLVEYSNVKFSCTKEEIEAKFCKEGYDAPTVNPNIKCIGSAKDYFVDMSGGKFIPNFVVSDIITLDKTMAYYGMNSSTTDNDVRPTEMVRDACKAVNANYDFSQFDNNGDGEVEFIYVVYAGYGENMGADSNTIWPHQWYMSALGHSVTLDGVKLDAYCCSNELYGIESSGKHLDGIGTVCHEFSHCLGLPDFYDVNYKNMGMSNWSLMASGNYNANGYIPVGYSAYEKDFLGWIKLEELTKANKYTLEPFMDSSKAYKIVNDQNPDEYYVLENRVKESWDKYMPAAGLMISHVDYDRNAWYSNNVNTNSSRQRMTLIPADGKWTENTLAGDLWPYKGNNELTDESAPAATVYTGGYMHKPVTKITKESNGNISFDYMGGVYVEVPEVAAATDVTATGFTANWAGVDAAAKYKVELYEVVPIDTTGNGGGTEEEKVTVESYVGKWNFECWDNSGTYTSVAELSKYESDGATYLICDGFSNLDDSYNYDDRFLIQYNEETGTVRFPAQYGDSIEIEGVKYSTVIYLADSEQMKVFGGYTTGRIKDGNIVFDNELENGYTANCFVYIFDKGGQLYLLSDFNSLEWTPVSEEAASMLRKTPVLGTTITSVMGAPVLDAKKLLSSIKKAESDENVLLKEDFAGFTATNKSIGKNCDDYFSVPGWSGSNIFSEGGAMRIGTSKYSGSVTTPTLSSNKMVEVTIDANLYSTSDNGVALTVSYTVGEETTVVATDYLEGESSFVYEFIPQGDFTVTISTNDGENKRVLITGVKVIEKMGKVSNLIATVETENTNYTFVDLATDTEYKYRVCTIDADGNDSDYSEFAFVVLGAPTDIENIVFDENKPQQIFDMMGREVNAINAPGLYIIRQGSNVTKILVK